MAFLPVCAYSGEPSIRARIETLGECSGGRIDLQIQENHPLEQGLKLYAGHVLEHLRHQIQENHPLEQGLKLGDNASWFADLRDSGEPSIRARIETGL